MSVTVPYLTLTWSQHSAGVFPECPSRPRGRPFGCGQLTQPDVITGRPTWTSPLQIEMALITLVRANEPHARSLKNDAIRFLWEGPCCCCRTIMLNYSVGTSTVTDGTIALRSSGSVVCLGTV